MSRLEEESARLLRVWRPEAARWPGRYAAVEVLWDGDTIGWYLCVTLIRRGSPGEPAFLRHALEFPRYGGDLRLFHGQVPPWPEAVIAGHAAGALARELGVELYFPSPDEPDLDCPEWSDRASSIPCRTCGKPLLRQRGPHLPADQCSPCHGKEVRRRELLEDKPGHHRVVHVAFEAKSGAARQLYVNLEHPVTGLDAQLATTLLRREPPISLSERVDAVLSRTELASLAAWCAAEFDSRLRAYQPAAHVHRLPAQWRRRQSFSSRGETREVDVAYDNAGAAIAQLVHEEKFFSDALAQDGVVYLFGSAGVSERDVRFLAFLRARAGSASVSALAAAFPFLSADRMEATVTKLVSRGFASRDGDDVRLLLRGRVTDVSGPGA